MVMWASLVTQTVKNMPAMQETQVRPLRQEDPMEKGLETYSGILAWRIPWALSPVVAMGLQRGLSKLTHNGNVFYSFGPDHLLINLLFYSCMRSISIRCIYL